MAEHTAIALPIREMEALYEDAKSDPNLAKALDDWLIATQSFAAQTSADQARRAIEKMPLKEVRAQLLASIDAYQSLLKTAGVLLLQAALQRPRARKATSDKAVQGKREKNPKLQAKAQALKLWKDWRMAKHPEIRTTNDFAKAVMERWPVITTEKTVCNWSARWNKQSKAGQNPSI